MILSSCEHVCAEEMAYMHIWKPVVTVLDVALGVALAAALVIVSIVAPSQLLLRSLTDPRCGPCLVAIPVNASAVVPIVIVNEAKEGKERVSVGRAPD
jgi:hypothetical protein